MSDYPTHARALILLPSGHRALDHDVAVPFPAPKTLDLGDPAKGVYHLRHVHHSGECDTATRALYVLGGVYTPQGFGPLERPDPEEIYDL